MKKRIFLLVAALLAAFTADARNTMNGKLQEVLRSHEIPSTEFMLGSWGYSDNAFVFFKESGATPSKADTDKDLARMTVNHDNCRLVFLDGKTCTFGVGKKQYKLTWTLNEKTREFKAGLAFFSVKGYLVRDGDNLALIYSKPDLEMMMRWLCPLSTHKYINELCNGLEQTPGLTVCILFSKD